MTERRRAVQSCQRVDSRIVSRGKRVYLVVAYLDILVFQSDNTSIIRIKLIKLMLFQFSTKREILSILIHILFILGGL